MPTNYNGDGTVPSAVSGYNPLNISSSTNANPIVVTTGSPHGYGTGDTVQIEGHLVNTNANGLHTITVLTASTFALNGVAGNGVGGATGYVENFSVRPLIQLISDGDILNASNLNPPPEANANAVPWLYRRVGAYQLYNIFRGAKVDLVDDVAWSTTSVSSSTWTTLTSATWAYQWSTGRNINIYNTDILMIKIATQVQNTFTTVTGTALGIGAAFNGGATTLITGSATLIQDNNVGQNCALEIALYASDFTATQLNYMTFSIMGYQTAVGAKTMALLDPYHVNILHYRINS